MPQKGDRAPTFALPTASGELRLEEALKLGKVVLAFYTEDGTPACMQQLGSFRDEYGTIKELGAQVIGISSDPLESHAEMDRRLGGLPFPLASDAELEVARLYGVVDDSGKRSHRAVFVIDTDGAVVHSIPWYQPGNTSQFLDVFSALGLPQE